MLKQLLLALKRLLRALGPVLVGCIFLGDPNKTSYSVVYFSEDGEYPYTLNDITGYVDAYIKLY